MTRKSVEAGIEEADIIFAQLDQDGQQILLDAFETTAQAERESLKEKIEKVFHKQNMEGTLEWQIDEIYIIINQIFEGKE